MIKDLKFTELVSFYEDKYKFYNATHYHICKEKVAKGDKKVRDHDHKTGKFRGAAHNKCKINYLCQ
jgi:hypothetical protein